jgi:hypothetical protein
MKRCIPPIFFAVALCDPLVTADAQPLDSPATVYIDGVPCNTPCQAYMEWSRRVQEGSRQIPPDAAPSNVGPLMHERVQPSPANLYRDGLRRSPTARPLSRGARRPYRFPGAMRRRRLLMAK